MGESRHRNLYLPYVPVRIHNFNPEAKLVAVLRNPAERAASHWWHWRSRGLEQLGPWASFEAGALTLRPAWAITAWLLAPALGQRPAPFGGR